MALQIVHQKNLQKVKSNLVYANSKNNFCSMGGGNTSCVYANVGKKDGSDDYLYAEFNLCEF